METHNERLIQPAKAKKEYTIEDNIKLDYVSSTLSQFVILISLAFIILHFIMKYGW